MSPIKLPWETQDDPTSKKDVNGNPEDPLPQDPLKVLESSSNDPPTDLVVPSTDPPVKSESPFTNPIFEGKTEKEIAEEMALLNLTVKEQGRTLTQLQNKPQLTPTPDIEPDPLEGVDGAAFFDDPIGNMRKVVKATIKEEMGTMIAPFSADLARNQAEQSWAQNSHLPNIAQLRPVIEAYLVKQGITSPNAQTVEDAYDLIIGKMQRNNVKLPGLETETVDPPTPTLAPPQHRASTQPLAQVENKISFRELTENEKLLARRRGMTDEQFLSWQEMDDSDVLKPAEVAAK